MTKAEFLDELKRALAELPEKDAGDSLEYYSEMIDDKVESGMSEEDAAAELGSPQDVAREIKLDMPLPSLIKTKYKKKNAWKVWEIILLVLGSPIWLSLGAVVFAIFITLYAVLWSVVVTFWVVDVAFAVFGLGCFVAFAASLTTGIIGALLYLGIGFFATGAAILAFFICLKLSALFVKLTVKLTRAIKSMFIERGNKDE